jgi:hypothetical protein
VQPIEAMAYDTPKTNIDLTVRSRPPRSSRGSRTVGSKPNSMAEPSRNSPIPMTIEIHRAFS